MIAFCGFSTAMLNRQMGHIWCDLAWFGAGHLSWEWETFWVWSVVCRKHCPILTWLGSGLGGAHLGLFAYSNWKYWKYWTLIYMICVMAAVASPACHASSYVATGLPLFTVVEIPLPKRGLYLWVSQSFVSETDKTAFVWPHTHYHLLPFSFTLFNL